MVRAIIDRLFEGDKRFVKACGLSTDQKTAGVITGSMFLEVDTGDLYAYDEVGETWGKIGNVGVSEDAITAAVNDWLDDHPEATTTVEDGAISYAKLDSSLQGTVDDVGELKSAIDEINDKTDQYIDTILGKNRLDVSANVTGRLNQDTGAIATDNDSQTTDFIRIGTSAIFSCGFSASSLTNIRCCLYDENKSFIPGSGRANIALDVLNIGDVYRNYFAIQTNGSAKYCRISFGNNVWGNSKLKPQIENGTAPTAYVDYVPDAYELKPGALPDDVFEENSGSEYLKSSAMPQDVFSDGEIKKSVLPNDVVYKAEFIPLLAEKTIKGYTPYFSPFYGTPISATVNSESAGKVVHCKKNLFNQEEFLLDNRIQKNADGYYYGFGSYFNAVKASLTLPKFKPHTNYIMSATVYSNTANMYWKFGFLYDDGSTRYAFTSTSTTAQRVVFNSTPDANLEKGYSKNVVGIVFTYSSSSILYIKDFQIEEAKTDSGYEAFTGESEAYESGENSFDFAAYDGINCVYSTTDDVAVNYYANKKSHRENAVAVCIGDSITGNYSGGTDYPALIEKITGMYVANGGFGGCRMSLHTNSNRANFSFCSLVDAIVSGNWDAQYNAASDGENGIANVFEHIMTLENTDWSKVKYLTVFFGTNDWTAQVPIDNDQNLKDKSTYLGSFRYGYEKLMETYPNIKVIAITPMYRYDDTPGAEWDTETQTFGGKYLYDFGDALIDVCKQYHIPYIDMYRISGVNAYTREEYIADGTHPTLAGRKNIADIVQGALMNN